MAEAPTASIAMARMKAERIVKVKWLWCEGV